MKRWLQESSKARSATNFRGAALTSWSLQTQKMVSPTARGTHLFTKRAMYTDILHTQICLRGHSFHESSKKLEGNKVSFKVNLYHISLDVK